MYELTGKITYEELMEFNKYHYKSMLNKTYNKVLFGAALILFFVTGFFDIVDFINYGKSIYNFSILPFLLFFLLFFVLLKFGLTRNVKKLFTSNAFYRETQKIVITEDSITITSDSYSTKLTKNNISKICFTEKAMYLYISTIQAYIISYDFINDKTKYNEITNFIKVNFVK